MSQSATIIIDDIDVKNFINLFVDVRIQKGLLTKQNYKDGRVVDGIYRSIKADKLFKPLRKRITWYQVFNYIDQLIKSKFEPIAESEVPANVLIHQ